MNSTISTAMILAAGRGERMRPLTDHTPKPLLQVGSQPLIGWHLKHIRQTGIRSVVINHAHLGEKIEDSLKSGEAFDVKIRYSAEGTALETAGGIAKALPFLSPDFSSPFLVVNGDVLADLPLQDMLLRASEAFTQGAFAYLVLVPNPAHNPNGDFSLAENKVGNDEANRLTFSGIGVYHPALFKEIEANQPAKLGPLLKSAAKAGGVFGERFDGTWIDVGTPSRLEDARNWVSQNWDATCK